MNTLTITSSSNNQQAIQVSTSWEAVTSTFLAEQDVRNNSRELYGRTLNLFWRWLQDTHRTVATLTRTDILQYKDDLFAEGLSPLTVGSYLTTVRKFFEWAEANKYYPNVAKGVKTPRRKQQFIKQHLTEESSMKLLQYYRDKADETARRDYAIVSLMLRTGLRTIEVIRADVGDITYRGDRRVLRIWGKGHDAKDDFVVLSDKAFEPIRSYLESRPRAKANEPLFTSTSHRNPGKRLTTRTISGLCKEGLREIGLDGREYTAHSLRHTTAVAILKRTSDIYKAQTVLRHSSPATTQIYTESIREEMRLQDAPELILDAAF